MISARISSAPSMRRPDLMARTMTLERLQQFNDAWSRGDVDVLMTFMTEDCVYEASVGPEPGRTFTGRTEVEAGFRAMLSHDSDGESKGGRCAVLGDLGIAEWSYVKTENGRAVEIRGCDIFEFVGDRIRRKNAFRKVFG